MRKRRHGYRQGIYKPINRDKYKGIKNPMYRSSWELKFFSWCDNNPNVLEWTSENTIIPYISPFDSKVHRYYVDNAVVIREGGEISKYLVEIKPEKQTKPPVVKKESGALPPLILEISAPKAGWPAVIRPLQTCMLPTPCALVSVFKPLRTNN